ncbi:MAG: hypothetical protein WD397_06580 [Wenzhouxiangellaceae bacterium]
MKSILIAATAGLMLSSLQAQGQAGSARAELLATHNPQHNREHRRDRDYHDYGEIRRHQRSHHRGTEYRQHHYDNARRYAASAVRQARRARQMGYYSDHPRWSLNFQRHFEWALRADAHRIEREARKRSRTLRELRHGHYSYPNY